MRTARSTERLAEIVFSDRSKLETLNTIIYPYITGEILRLIKNIPQTAEVLYCLMLPPSLKAVQTISAIL